MYQIKTRVNCGRLQMALVVLCAMGWASPGTGAQKQIDISGAGRVADSNCPSPVAIFNQDDCAYDASSPLGGGGIVTLQWIGPLFSAGYYAPGTAPGPDVDDGIEPVPGDGKTPPPVTGTIQIDDQDTATGTDDTIAGALVIGPSVRNFGAGSDGTGEETWTSRTINFTAVTVDSAVSNGDGGFDYLIGDQGLPAPLVDIATGTDFWPSEDGPDSDSNPTIGDYWAAAGPVGIATFEANPSLGTTGTTSAVGYSCNDVVDGVGGADSACDGTSLLGDGVSVGNLDFENILLALSTNADGHVTSAKLLWVQEVKIFFFLPGADSWIAGVIDFTGTCNNCSVPADAVDDTYSVDRNSIDNVLSIGANDVGFTTPASVVISTLPDQGGASVVQNSPGNPTNISVNYTPLAGFSGTETFGYTMADGVNSRTATVTVLVTTLGVNDDLGATRLNVPISIAIGANDQGFVDPTTATISLAPDQGGTAVIQNSPGAPAAISVDYTPIAPLGTPTYIERFGYTLNDGITTGAATVAVTVRNAVPSAPDLSVTTGEAEPLDIAPIGAGADPGDGPTSVTVAAQPVNGSVTVANNVLTYTPTGFFIGADSFDYAVQDVDTESATGTVDITVGPAAVPVAQNDKSNVVEGQSVQINVTANDVAGSGALADHVVAIVMQPAGGSVAVGAGNIVTYSAPVDGAGGDSFQYTLEDQNGDVSAPATVEVGIAADRQPQIPGSVSAATGPWSLVLLIGALLPARRAWRRRRTVH